MSKEIDKKQKTESGGHSVNTVISPKFIIQSSYVPQSKGEAEAKDFLTMIQETSKHNYLLITPNIKYSHPKLHILLFRQDIQSPHLRPDILLVTLEE